MAEKVSKDSSNQPLVQKINIVRSNDHRFYYSNGAMIGPTPRAEISVQFYQEENIFPQVKERTVLADGTTSEKETQHPQNEVDRVIQTTITLNPLLAKNLGKLLMDKSDEILAQMTTIREEISARNE